MKRRLFSILFENFWLKLPFFSIIKTLVKFSYWSDPKFTVCAKSSTWSRERSGAWDLNIVNYGQYEKHEDTRKKFDQSETVTQRSVSAAFKFMKIQSIKFSLQQKMKLNFFKSCSFRVPRWLRIITCGSRAEYNIWIRYTAYYLTWLNIVFCF